LRGGVFAIPSEAERQRFPFYSEDRKDKNESEELNAVFFWQHIFGKFCPERNANRLSSFNTRTMPMLLHWGLKGEKRAQAYELHHDRERRAEISEWQRIEPFAGMKVVDFGSGEDGDFARFLNTLGANTIGLDVGSKSPLVLRMQDIISGKITLQPVADIALVTNMYEDSYGQTLCHPEWGKIADGVLKPGGLILVSNALPEIIGNREIFPGVVKDPALHREFELERIPCRIERKKLA